MSAPFPIPTGLHHSAQGCRVREATLGNRPKKSSTLKGLHPSLHSGLMQPRWGWGNILGIFPRVARASQPWADGCYPVGVNRIVRPRVTRPSQRRLVAELDAEAAQMEAVRSLLPRFEAKIQRVLDRVWWNGESGTATAG
jgi:hypothetical protein